MGQNQIRSKHFFSLSMSKILRRSFFLLLQASDTQHDLSRLIKKGFELKFW